MKKHFRSAFALIIALFTLTMAGCSTQVPTTLGGSYFLQNAGNISIIGNVNEVNEYSVTFTPSNATAANDVKIALVEEDGLNLLTTTLTNTVYNETECYLLESVLKTKISYVLYGENVGVFENYVSQKVYFLSVSNKLKPLYSQTTANANTPVTDKNGKYSVVNLKYSFSVTYSDDTAVADFVPEKGEYGIPSGEREYKKYNSKTNYFDNNAMLFMPRAIKLTDSASLQFSCIDVLSGANRNMTMASDSTKPSEDLIFSTTNTEQGVIPHAYYINSRKLFVNGDSQVIPCHVVNFAVSGTFSGTPIKCWYADTADNYKEARARLIKMESTALYSLGTFTYIIKKTTTVD